MTEPSPIRWDRLGHPHVELARAMSRAACQAATPLERGVPQIMACEFDDISLQPMPGLLVYATMREFLPCAFDEVIATIGVETSILRVRQFADIIDNRLMVN